ncbi:hypothetical protein TD95_000394 [Thielaviopsis punctulata]|uniref:Major facilitator superfamily (MFS) profile domain-containing protein n=1 Tax=Thielaviopsis punctulata TaxID=72032 RepID=A0A0F4ZBC9_9PEZI|nr:hypothetical protein TD95_000394 [Thielaviopsis punctulata]
MGMIPKYFGLQGRMLNVMIGLCAGMDFLLFGYDQGVMGGILTMENFLDLFPMIDPDRGPASESSSRSTKQGISIGSYNLGCFAGAIIAIFIANKLGRKRMIMLGTSIMIIGAILQATAYSLSHLIIGRIITGLGNGINTSTVPTWQSETSQSHNRGAMVMVEGALISGGIMVSYWIDLGFSFAPGSVSWRVPLAFQIFFCLVILGTVWNLPESPRWLLLKDREAEAREVIAALSCKEESDPYVTNELKVIRETVLEMSKGSFKDLFTMDENRHLHRVTLAYVNQMFQQISGINLITYYAPVIYKGLGMSDFLSRLLAALGGMEFFIMSLPSIWLIERVGRRKLMIIGAIGQAIAMATCAGVNAYDSLGCQITAVVFLWLFNTFFGIGWLGMTWLYPAEIVPLRIRAPANGLSTSANWIWNFMVVMITPVSFNDIGHWTYLIFAIINALIVPCVYFFFPETALRSLEEMDLIFRKVKGASGCWRVVDVARKEPQHYGRNGELLIPFTEDEKASVSQIEGEKSPQQSVGGIMHRPTNGSSSITDEESQ